VTVEHLAVSPVFEGPNSFLEIACFSSRCRGSCVRLEAAKEIGAPDVECGAVGAFPGVEGLYRGPESIGEWMDVIRSEWEEFEVTLDKVLASGRESPISPSHLRNGSGRASPGPRVAIMRTRVG
jgi:hypothetical protein